MIVDVVLRDGATLVVREATNDDRQAIEDLLRPLSGRVRPPIDGGGGLILVGESGRRLLALGSFAQSPTDPNRAEIAFAVADDAQDRGIGTCLLEVLADAARQRRIRQFDAFVPGTNEQMLRMLLDSGFTLTKSLDSDVLHVTLTLAESPRHESRSAERSRAAATASIAPFFSPRSVAIIGASPTRGKIGSELLHNIVAGRFTGTLFVVHPSAREVAGVPALPRVTDIKDEIDLAIIAVPAAQVDAVLDDCIAKHVKALVIISAGFGEASEAGRAAEAVLVRKVRQAGIRMVGPNCLGVLNTDPSVRLNATFSPVFPPAGGVAMSTQSGALGLAILDWARRLNIGISSFVSVGNKADVSGNDLLQYWADDPRTAVIVLYLESFGNPRKFRRIARLVARTKPIVAVKAGRSRVGAKAASSHTGALVSDDAIVDALFQQCGVIRADTMQELFDVTMLVATQPIPAGPRVAILTNAGGPGILAADACESHGLVLPTLSDATTNTLKSLLPTSASVANPVDMIASATADQYEHALTALLSDANVDSVIAIFIPPLVTKTEDVAAAIRRAASGQRTVPIVPVIMSSESTASILAPLPCFAFPEAACVALARATAYGAWRDVAASRPDQHTPIDAERARAIIATTIARGEGWASYEDTTALLDAAGIHVVPGRHVADEEGAVVAAATLGYPVVLKGVGPELLHKTELKAVRVGIRDEESLRRAWRDLTALLGRRMSSGLVQQMVAGGVEMLVGAVDDPLFGGVIACASGGVLTEILADRQLRLAPLTRDDAREMIEGLRGAALLHGHRGQAAVDDAALQDALVRLSELVELCPEIRECDINPLIVLPQGAVAVDVRMRLARPRPPSASRRVRY